MSTFITGEEICEECKEQVGVDHPEGNPIAANLVTVSFDRETGKTVKEPRSVVWHRKCCPEIVIKMMEAQKQ